MINLQNLVPGRIYSFRHHGEVEMRKRDLPEWLRGAVVTATRAFKGNLANRESYANKQRQRDPEWERKGGAWFDWTEQNGLVVHKTTGRPYLAVVNPETIKTTFFINGVEATETEAEAIRQYRRSQREFGVFAVFDLEKVEFEGELTAAALPTIN